MDVSRVFIYIVLTTWAFEFAHGTFADFLEHLPKKMGKAFGVTWARMKDLNVNMKLTRKQRMGDYYHNKAPDESYMEQSTQNNMESYKLVIPILPTPRSKYRYLWRSTVKQSNINAKTKFSSELPPALPLILKASGNPSVPALAPHTPDMTSPGVKKPETMGQAISFDVMKFKHFRLRVFYKWELGFL